GSEIGDGISVCGTDTHVSAHSRLTTTPDFNIFLYAWKVEGTRVEPLILCNYRH
ncbi:hypothetical protein MKX03_008031, partial [Papaver bracteatum]